MRRLSTLFGAGLVLAIFVAGWFAGCKKDDNALAPYMGGGTDISTFTVENTTFTPKATWVGGYVTVFGVNRGPRAALDSTLVWMIVQPGNAIQYPVRYGTVPQGAQELSAQYGGTSQLRLTEDNTYTFWVMKDDAWNLISGQRNKKLVLDRTLVQPAAVRGDSIALAETSFDSYTQRLDVYINIKDVKSYGRLGTINVIASDTTNYPLITFKVTQSGVTDTLISAIGIVRGGMYLVNQVVWEMISEDIRPDTTIYWKNDVIASPLRAGQSVPGTATFSPLSPDALVRGQSYYIWIANKNWDQETRIRSTPNYAFATFTVW